MNKLNCIAMNCFYAIRTALERQSLIRRTVAVAMPIDENALTDYQILGCCGITLRCSIKFSVDMILKLVDNELLEHHRAMREIRRNVICLCISGVDFPELARVERWNDERSGVVQRGKNDLVG